MVEILHTVHGKPPHILTVDGHGATPMIGRCLDMSGGMREEFKGEIGGGG